MSSKQYHVVALVTDAFGGHGGISQYNSDLLTALAGSGRVAAMCVLPRSASQPAVLPPCVDQWRPSSGRVGYIAGALRASLSRAVEVVFCGHLYMAPLVALIARLKRAKLVIQMHGIEAWPRPSRLLRIAVEHADLILCVSRYTRARVLSWASVAPERVVVLPNTVDEIFTPGPGTLRASLGLEGNRVLLTVGRLDARERYKGHDRVMRAIPSLVAQGHDIAYVVAGQGDDLQRLEALAAELKIADRVRFLGALSRAELADVYRAADLFVMPSTGEGFGIAFLEAMASGTPALGLDAAGASDALADGELGMVVTEDELTAAIARSLSAPKPDPNALSARVRARFGRDAFSTRAVAAFDRLLTPQ